MFRKLVAAAVLTLVTGASFAAQQWGTVTPSSAAFSGDESSLFTFSLGSGASFAGLTISTSDLSSVSIDGNVFTQVSNVPDFWMYNGSLAAGLHTITVLTGPSFVPGGDTFSGAVTVAGITTISATPVPEPETFALMLAGLGAVSFMARRRQAK